MSTGKVLPIGFTEVLNVSDNLSLPHSLFSLSLHIASIVSHRTRPEYPS